jgi:YVTN family beta-propeller protein
MGRRRQAHRQRAVPRIPWVVAGLLAAIAVVTIGARQLIPAADHLIVASAAGASATARTPGSGQHSSSSTAPTPPPMPPPTPTPTQPTPTPTPTPSAASPLPSTGPSAISATNLYAATGAGMFAPAVAGVPARVYVPDEATGTVVVIDPGTFKVLFRYPVGASPEHVTPDWDLKRLYVEAAFGNRLTVIDPVSGRPIGRHTVPGPYNLYFTIDGRRAIVVLDSSVAGIRYGGHKQVYFYDRRTWRLIKALDVPWAGADHLDFAADGSFFLLSTEYSGRLVKVDVRRMAITGVLNVKGRPIDVRLAPDGKAFFVTNQTRNGVSIIDASGRRELAFLHTGRGAHGLAISRDAKWLYVSNRAAGSLSVIDFATRRVIRTWRIGGSPDMIAVSPDGTRLWISNRFGGTVSVVDARTGRVVRIVRVGGRPHGLAYFPEPGRFSIGHNGMYR